MGGYTGELIKSPADSLEFTFRLKHQIPVQLQRRLSYRNCSDFVLCIMNYNLIIEHFPFAFI
jgi:hypothetical protein